MKTIVEYMKRKFPKANAKRILGVESEYDDQRQVNSMYSRYNYEDLRQADVHVLCCLGWFPFLQKKWAGCSTAGFI